jgi:hypothetical protein
MASFEELQKRAHKKGMKVIRSPQYGYYLMTGVEAIPCWNLKQLEAMIKRTNPIPNHYEPPIATREQREKMFYGK